MKHKPTIDGFDIELIDSVETGIEKAVVEYDVPFAGGAILDDMGVKARRFNIKTIWRRENYEAHIYFIEHVRLNQLNRFVHPELGAINGRIKSANVIHDDRIKCAEISVEFIEDATPDVQPLYNPPLAAAMEEGFNQGAAALINSTAATFADNGLDAGEGAIDGKKSLAGQIAAKTFSARALLIKMDVALSALNGAFNECLNPIESAVGACNYGLSMPGVIIGATARAVERAAIIASAAAAAPETFLSSLRAGTSRLAASIPALQDSIRIATASIAAVFVGKILEDDEAAKSRAQNIEDAPHWRPDTTALNVPSATRVLTADALTRALDRLRTMAREGTIAARNIGSDGAVSAITAQVKIMSEFIHRAAQTRDRTKTVTVADDTPLHLICLRHGLPYTYADRIAAMNPFFNPTFCYGEVKIYELRR